METARPRAVCWRRGARQLQFVGGARARRLQHRLRRSRSTLHSQMFANNNAPIKVLRFEGSL